MYKNVFDNRNRSNVYVEFSHRQTYTHTYIQNFSDFIIRFRLCDNFLRPIPSKWRAIEQFDRKWKTLFLAAKLCLPNNNIATQVRSWYRLWEPEDFGFKLYREKRREKWPYSACEPFSVRNGTKRISQIENFAISVTKCSGMHWAFSKRKATRRGRPEYLQI